MRHSLVVGGAGFIGSALVRVLAPDGRVRVLDDLTTGRRDNIEGIDGVELLEGSLLDQPLVREAMRDVDVVFHLACKGVRHSVHSPTENHHVNATGTLLLLQAALDAGVQRFVYTSTSEVYGTAITAPMTEDHPTLPHTVYGGSKLAGEAYVRAYHLTYGLPAVVLRPFNAYGPRSHHEGDSGEVIPKFIVRAMNGLPPVIFGDGSQTRDFTYVDDTAAGIAAAAVADGVVGRTLNLGSGKEIAIDELAHVVLEAVDRPDIEPIYDEPRPGDVLRLIADSRAAVRELTWKPSISLDEGIRRLLTWHAQRGTDWEAALADDTIHNWKDAS